MENLKISSKSNPNSVAGMVKETKSVEIQAIGAEAVNQAVKAIAIARGYMAPLGKNLICIPAFSEVQVENEEKTGMKFIVIEQL